MTSDACLTPVFSLGQPKLMEEMPGSGAIKTDTDDLCLKELTKDLNETCLHLGHNFLAHQEV